MKNKLLALLLCLSFTISIAKAEEKIFTFGDETAINKIIQPYLDKGWTVKIVSVATSETGAYPLSSQHHSHTIIVVVIQSKEYSI